MRCRDCLGCGWLLRCLPCLSRHRQIHPNLQSSSKGGTSSIFFEIDSLRCLHVWHLKANTSSRISTSLSSLTDLKYFNNKRLSMVSTNSELSNDEYWFTRWSRPIKISEHCNCSFRKSWRKSSNNTEAKKIERYEDFAKNFVDDILSDAIKCLETKKEGNGCVHHHHEKSNGTSNKDLTGGFVNFSFVDDTSSINAINGHGSSKDDTRIVSKSRNGQNEGVSCTRCHRSRIRRLKPVILLIHGMGSCSALWTYLARYLSNRGFDVVAPDLLGHGLSSAPNNPTSYHFQSLVEDCLIVFDHFVRQPRRCVIIGHAYGCSLAAAMARYRSTLVSHLILISGGGPTPLAPKYPEPTTWKRFFSSWRQPIHSGPYGKFSASHCPELSQSVPAYVLEHMAQGQDWPEGDAAFHRRILSPTLIVHGQKDPHVPLVQECEMERTIPRSFLELIPNAGHLPMLDAPARLSHMVHCFIDWWARYMVKKKMRLNKKKAVV